MVSLFAPPLLAATTIGALLGHLTKKHEEKELGAELDEYFPSSSSAGLVVIDDKYLDRVEAALTKADKNVSMAISQDDYNKFEQAISDSQQDVDDAVDS